MEPSTQHFENKGETNFQRLQKSAGLAASPGQIYFGADMLSGQFANPVCFPRFAAVGRERLLHPRRFRRDIQPDVTYQNRAPFILFLILELAAIAGKLANNRRQVESAFVQVQRVDTPLMRVRIV
jgi:hypothetical protein